MNQKDRALHSLGVAKLMYELALENGSSQEYANEMYSLGWNHDIGYQFSDSLKGHAQIGGALLRSQGYKYWEEVYYHGDPHTTFSSEALELLNYADMRISSNGEAVSFEERLYGIEERCGRDSANYINAKQIVERLNQKNKDCFDELYHAIIELEQILNEHQLVVKNIMFNIQAKKKQFEEIKENNDGTGYDPDLIRRLNRDVEELISDINNL